MDEIFESESTDVEAFHGFTHSIYDGCFAYRFLIRLRDFSQHGHPPVSQKDMNYFFDLRQILEMPHFTHNKQIKEQLSASVAEIMDAYHGYPHLGITMTVAEFTVGLWNVYHYFLSCVKTHLQKSFTQAQTIIERYPKNIVLKKDEFSGLFVYSVNDKHANVITVGENTIEMLEQFQLEAKRTLEIFQENWDELKKGVFLLKKMGKCLTFRFYKSSLST